MTLVNVLPCLSFDDRVDRLPGNSVHPGKFHDRCLLGLSGVAYSSNLAWRKSALGGYRFAHRLLVSLVSLMHVSNVLLLSSAVEMLRIYTWPVVASVKRKVGFKTMLDEERNSMSKESGISKPHTPVATYGGGVPLPALVWTLPINLIPESLSIFSSNRRKDSCVFLLCHNQGRTSPASC